MMPESHARLSPSASERWIQCPASIRMATLVEHPGPPSEWAQEGTNAHELAEIEAAETFGLWSEKDVASARKVWRRKVTDEEAEEMQTHANSYVEFLESIFYASPSSEILLEKRVDTGVPHCWGTADAVLVSPKEIHIVDFKYGKGVRVDVTENSQLRLYGVGALDLYDVLDDIETVSVSVYQPRLNNYGTETLAAVELREWRDTIVAPVAKEALGPDAPFGPSETACRWCPAAGECKPRMDHVLALDFGSPEIMSPEETGEALLRLKEIRSWCEDVEKVALEKAYSQSIPIPGWKVIRSGGRRVIPDAAAAIQVLVDNGFTTDEVSRLSMRTLAELEKVVGKEELPDILGELMTKTPGRESLVPEDDSRPAISPASEAARDFS